MTYEESINYLNEISENVGITPGLGNIKLLAGYFRNPQKSYKVIHIAGTNGKGSVGTFIANILSVAGYSVGRYVSPSVTCYNDKIQFVDNNRTTYINDDEVASYVSMVKELIDSDISGDGFAPSVFEIETVMALMAFRDRKVDYAVIECGMGGKEDATNVLNHKELCVFTSISMDHTAYLGETLTDIATQKAGILRPGCKAVSTLQQKEVNKVFDELVQRSGIHMRYIDIPRLLETGVNGSLFLYANNQWHIPVAGTYQIENASLAIEAVHLLNDNKITDEIIQKGLDNASWPGRFEIIFKNPFIIYDGAHNPQGIKALVNGINSLFKRHSWYRRAFFGVFSDKDYIKMIDGFAKEFDEIHVIKAKGKRAIEPERIAELISNKYNIDVAVHGEDNIIDLIKQYDNIVNEKMTVNVIFGSLSMYPVKE